ncbi:MULTISPECIES: hypothetical protein [unclassified Psychrobacter]|uniref:hypothetical protein n=1 Tax=unclassified Psychrobacter TaxID=196806 RepID=UPI0018F6A0F7|nr:MULTISPECIES: hypothetical protein [unclassified Psychrobacter]
MNNYKEQGIPTVTLESILTAKSFYLKQGFTITDNVRGHGEVVTYKMVKTIGFL